MGAGHRMSKTDMLPVTRGATVFIFLTSLQHLTHVPIFILYGLLCYCTILFLLTFPVIPLCVSFYPNINRWLSVFLVSTFILS